MRIPLRLPQSPEDNLRSLDEYLEEFSPNITFKKLDEVEQDLKKRQEGISLYSQPFLEDMQKMHGKTYYDYIDSHLETLKNIERVNRKNGQWNHQLQSQKRILKCYTQYTLQLKAILLSTPFFVADIIGIINDYAQFKNIKEYEHFLTQI